MLKHIHDKKIREHVLSRYKEIDVNPGECRYNFRCHNNAVHEAIESGENSVAMVIIFEDGEPILHFINYDGEKFTDNTLGHWVSGKSFYLIRMVQKSEFLSIGGIFDSAIKEFRRILPFWLRVLNNDRC